MRLRGVGKRYQRRAWALSGVDVDLVPGERIALRGGNGSGKSTLIRIMVGVTRPSTGRVWQRPAAIGYMPERFPSDTRMSARSYLTHMGRIRGLDTKTAARRVDELLARLALAGGPDSPLRELSKGNTRKVALAQAVLVPAELLVLDEPWSGLDRTADDVLVEIMRETSRRGGMVVFTDHRESVVRTHADRVYRLADGHLTDDEHDAARPEPTRVVLRSPLDEPDQSGTAELRARDEVFSAHTDADHLVLHVCPERTDQLVLSALLDGWSLVAVSGADTGATPRESR